MIATLFVYGTLQNGMLEQIVPQINHYIQFGEAGYVKGRLYDLGIYPGAKPSKSDNKKVYGQLIFVTPGFEERVLKVLDEYEEYLLSDKSNSLFIRRKVKVVTKNAEIVLAWIYWYNKSVKEEKEIISGSYNKKYSLKNYAID